MKKELREIAAEASSNLGWWQPWQFAEQVGPKEAAFIAAMGCARTYAYEYSKGDVRLINAAYVRLQNNLLIAIKMINP